jgi:Mg2+/citrate symporter
MLPGLECVSVFAWHGSYSLNKVNCLLQIRINFYVTIILLTVIQKTPETEELLLALLSSAGLAGLGLLVTAIIQTVTEQLSLFHALFIFHILFFFVIGASSTGECSGVSRPSCLTFKRLDACR